MKELKKRKTIRINNSQFYNSGVFFITICTIKRQCILSHIVGTGYLQQACPDGPLSHIVGTDSLRQACRDGPRIELTRYGKIADKYIKQLNEFYDHISVKSYVIMPNHIHMLLHIKENGPSGTPVPTLSYKTENGPSGQACRGESVPTLSHKTENGPSIPTIQNSSVSRFVSTFKRFCNKECGENIWQYRSHDHIIRNQEDYEEHLRYIHQYPSRWHYDELYNESLE